MTANYTLERVDASRQFMPQKVAALAAVALSLLVWLMSLAFISQTLGDVFVADQVERARIIHSRDFWSKISFTATVGSLFISTAAAGYGFEHHRWFSLIALSSNVVWVAVVVASVWG